MIELKKKMTERQFLELFLSLLEGGFSVASALAVLMEGRETESYARIICRGIAEDKSISDSLCRVSPALERYRMMTAACEQTGEIIPALKNITEEMEQKEEGRKNLIASALYPAFIMVLALTLSIVFGKWGIPSLRQIARVDEKKLVKALIFANGFLLVTVPLLIFLMREMTRKHDFSYSLFTNLYYLSLSGVGMEQALSVILGEGHMKKKELKKILEIRKELRGGKSLYEVFGTSGLCDTFTLSWLGVAENSGNAAEAFLKISTRYRMKKKEVREKALKITEPSLMVLCGIYVALIAAGCVIPVFMSLGEGIIF